MKVKSEDRAEYCARTLADSKKADDLAIADALFILAGRLKKSGDIMCSPKIVKDFLRLRYADMEHEVFVVLWLDAQNRLIAHEQLFQGTLTQTSVYPREVVKAALACNAGACILVHNHPSGLAEASGTDFALTSTLKQALALVDCKVLDHMIVAGATVYSFAETGRI